MSCCLGLEEEALRERPRVRSREWSSCFPSSERPKGAVILSVEELDLRELELESSKKLRHSAMEAGRGRDGGREGLCWRRRPGEERCQAWRAAMRTCAHVRVDLILDESLHNARQTES